MNTTSKLTVILRKKTESELHRMARLHPRQAECIQAELDRREAERQRLETLSTTLHRILNH